MPTILRQTMRALAALLLAAAPALGNDSTASLDTGELVLVPNPDIRMAEEDLYISRDEIRVRYVFLNTSDQPITTPVAFPLPPVDFSWETEFAVDAPDPENFVGFRLWIDGRPVKFRIDARATVEGRDVTALLRKWKVPITTFTTGEDGWRKLRDRLDALPPLALAELRAAGAIHGPDWGDGFNEAWTAHVSFYWDQTFPPGTPVTVEHRYAPVPTYTFFGEYDLQGGHLRDEACIDKAFEAAARRRLAGAEYGALSATILRYILVTANNWRGSIGRFHLTIDKGSTDAIVSLCRDGIRKTGPTTFEWTGTNFRPARDLVLLFLAPLPTE